MGAGLKAHQSGPPANLLPTFLQLLPVYLIRKQSFLSLFLAPSVRQETSCIESHKLGIGLELEVPRALE